MPNARDISSRLAAVMMNHRALSSVALLIVTLFFGWGLQGVELRTIFSDLLPKNHPFVQTYKDHPNFGNPLTDPIPAEAQIPCLDAACPPHMAVVGGTKMSTYDVAAWADLWLDHDLYRATCTGR